MINLVYIAVSALVISFLGYIILRTLRSENEYKNVLVLPIAFGMAGTLFYCLCLLSLNHFSAVLFDSLYFCSIDWMTFFMLRLCLYITGNKPKNNIARNIFIGIAIVDSVSQVLNCFFNHTFNLSRAVTVNCFPFWSLAIYPPHYIHLGICYVFTLCGMVMLFVWSIKSSVIYKKRYLGILIPYIVIIIVNFFCYSQNYPVDFSILLYGTLAGFISYFSSYMVPRSLVSESLANFHESIDDAIICFDLSGTCIYVNPSGRMLFEKDGKFSAGLASDYRKKWISNSSNNNESFTNDEMFVVRGEEFYYTVEYETLFDGEKEIGSYMKLQNRTNELNNLFKEHYIATHDQLTGIYNRDYFFEMADKRLKESPDVKRIMIASNIKDFKFINELFGTRKGDEVLCKQADMMRQLAHKDNVYGRISNDKFALMMREDDYVSSIFLQSMKSLGKLVEGGSYQMRIKMGIYRITDVTESASLIYDKALMAVQQLSDDYQQTFSYYDNSLMELVLREKQIVADFDKALSENQFKIYLQPVVDGKGDIYGAETFIRWHNPERGIMMPEFFNGILEKTGLMYKLDLYIWEQIISKLKKWELDGKKNFTVTIFVSPKDLYYIDVGYEICELTEKYGIDATRLKVMFYEESISSDIERVVDIFNQLHEKKIEIGICDFGKGVSSLNLIENLDIDCLKVDVNLIGSLEDERSKIILDFVLKMAKSLGMIIVGEKVDSKETEDYLKSQGTNFFTGGDFSIPIKINDFEKKYLNLFS